MIDLKQCRYLFFLHLTLLSQQEREVLTEGKHAFVMNIFVAGLLFWQGGLKSRIFREEFGVGLSHALPIRVRIHKLQALGGGEYHAAGQAACPARTHLHRLFATRLGIRVPHLLLLDGISNDAASPLLGVQHSQGQSHGVVSVLAGFRRERPPVRLLHHFRLLEALYF